MKKKIIRITEGEFLNLMTNLIKEEITRRMMCEEETVSDDGATVGEEPPSIGRQIWNASKYTLGKLGNTMLKTAGMDPIENKKKEFTDSEAFQKLTPQEQETIRKFHKNYFGR